ncbi:hypothetical protein PR048_007421 [Dryococelus australis]|uniref:Uncharacterized protein n=1 Tax=Dryococelus australis TaxID=614101 RepID=A0ABQ9HU71_9NEOP|nr:hypothetical protein PR048_007421 [Dryococelus australis]
MLVSHQGEPSSIPGAKLPDFHKWELWRAMPWLAGFRGDLQFPQPLHFSAAPYSLQSPSSAFKTSQKVQIGASLRTCVVSAVMGLAPLAVSRRQDVHRKAHLKSDDLFDYAENKAKYAKPIKRKGFNEALVEIEKAVKSGAGAPSTILSIGVRRYFTFSRHVYWVWYRTDTLVSVVSWREGGKLVPVWAWLGNVGGVAKGRDDGQLGGWGEQRKRITWLARQHGIETTFAGSAFISNEILSINATVSAEDLDIDNDSKLVIDESPGGKQGKDTPAEKSTGKKRKLDRDAEVAHDGTIERRQQLKQGHHEVMLQGIFKATPGSLDEQITLSVSSLVVVDFSLCLTRRANLLSMLLHPLVSGHLDKVFKLPGYNLVPLGSILLSGLMQARMRLKDKIPVWCPGVIPL